MPGAIIVKNNHASEFFLKTITLDDVPGHGTVVFVANSWIYPPSKYRYNRVFFSNDVSTAPPIIAMFVSKPRSFSYLSLDMNPLHTNRRTCPARCRRR